MLAEQTQYFTVKNAALKRPTEASTLLLSVFLCCFNLWESGVWHLYASD